MNNEKLKLDSKGRFKIKSCPCGKTNRDGKFVPFEGQERFGYCHACTKAITPDNSSSFVLMSSQDIPKKRSETIYIAKEYLVKSKSTFRNNKFIQFISSNYGAEITKKIIELYHLGSSKRWNGANVFWYIDQALRVRTGKIMLYNKITCKRVKDPKNLISWVHSELKIPNEQISKCLFGEHLVTQFPNKPIAIVESEKTAVIASLYFPNLNWLATGGIGNLNYEKLKGLKDKAIVLFPDLGAYHIWLAKHSELKKWFNIRISDFLEKNASDIERKQKYDLADFLLKYALSDFQTLPVIT